MVAGSLFGDCCRSCCDDPCGDDPCGCSPCMNCCDDPCDPCGDPCGDTCGSCDCSPCCCEPCDFCPPAVPDTPAYNAPMFYDIKCTWDMFASVSFVYAQAKEENLHYMETTKYVTTGSNEVYTGSFSTLSFDYEPAFKVGLGFTMGCDNWDFYTEYFRYHADVGSGSFSDTVPDSGFLYTCCYLSPFTEDVDNKFTSVSGSTKWRLEMDMIDFNLRRRYYVGKCLLFQTAVGIRAGWIDQKQTTNYYFEDVITPTVVNTNVTNSYDSWAVGAKAAVDTEWLFCGAFRFFGNAGVAILYTDYNSIKSSADSSSTNNGGTPTTKTYSSSRSLCYLRPDASIALGLGWGDYWCCNDWYFDLSAAYEFHTYWNQNVLPQLKVCSQDPSAFNGDLYLHGLVITARLDF